MEWAGGAKKGLDGGGLAKIGQSRQAASRTRLNNVDAKADESKTRD